MASGTLAAHDHAQQAVAHLRLHLVDGSAVAEYEQSIIERLGARQIVGAQSDVADHRNLLQG